MPKRAEPASPSLPLDDVSDTPAADDAVARFEQEMQELESIVAQMEKGELRLEDSLKLFERGTQLARSCRRSLDTAELKVRTLLGDDGEESGAA